MQLQEKGPIKPPPVLRKYPEQVSREIQSWKNIISATHWDLYDRSRVDGADFYVGQTELGHIHLDGEVHLAIGKELAAILIKNKLANKFQYGNEWVTTPITLAKDVQHAIWLFKLNYSQINGQLIEKLKRKIDDYKSEKIPGRRRTD